MLWVGLAVAARCWGTQIERSGLKIGGPWARAATVGWALAGLAAAMATALPARADFQAGAAAFARGDYQAAIHEWLPYAAENDPRALFNLGQIYRLGLGVEKDLAKAEQYYRRAADLGHVGAQGNLGSLYFEREPPEGAEAVRYWRLAARGGDPRSQYLLGIQYFNGDHVPRDYVVAHAWLGLAAAAGLPEAVRALATVKSYLDPPELAQSAKLAATLVSAVPMPESTDPSKPRDAGRPDLMAAAQQESALLRHPVDDLAPAELVPVSPEAVRGAVPLTDVVDAPPPRPAPPAAGPAERVAHRAQFAGPSDEAAARALRERLLRRHAALLGGADILVEGGVPGSGRRLRTAPLADEAAAKALCAAAAAAGDACQVVKTMPVAIALRGDVETTPSPAPAPRAAPAATAPRPVQVVPVRSAASGDDRWRVQVGAGRTEEEARLRWSRLVAGHADLLDAVELFIFRADLGDKGVYHRIQLGRFARREPAIALCERLKRRAVDCFVTPSP
jgi:TPR repeat protein